MDKAEPSVRDSLLDAASWFVPEAARLPGVQRIAFIGSIASQRPDPKDLDLLVWVASQTDLTPLAALGRRLKGRLQSQNLGADVFLADEHGNYLGRTCSWKECGPGFRASCDAEHCGRRHYLHDDLATVRLAAEVIAAPPVDLWPVVARRAQLPADVEGFLASLNEPHNYRVNLSAGGTNEVK